MSTEHEAIPEFRRNLIRYGGGAIAGCGIYLCFA